MLSELVECRSDSAYIGYPVTFMWQDKRLVVNRIVSETRDSSGYSFRVIHQEYGCFDLTYDINTDQWSVQQP